MKENNLISLTVLKDAFANTLSRFINEGLRQHIMETFDTSIGYIKSCHLPLVFLKGKEEDECVHLDKVTWLEADGSYTKFHSIDGKTQILTANLASTLRQLEVIGYNNFLRIHHSYALNIDYITSRCGNTLYIGKQEFTIGRNYKKYVEEHIITLKK